MDNKRFFFTKKKNYQLFSVGGKSFVEEIG